MSTKTFYIRPDDEAIWDKAKRLILLHEGVSLSQHLTDHLRLVVEEYEALLSSEGESLKVLIEAMKGLQAVGYLEHSTCATKEGAAALRAARAALRKVGSK
jgi:hypothetical protein